MVCDNSMRQLGRVVKATDLKSVGATRVGSNPAADVLSGYSSDGRAIVCSRSISVIRISIGHWFESGCPELFPFILII